MTLTKAQIKYQKNRQRVLARIKENHRQHSDDPLYNRIVRCRKKRWEIAQSIKLRQRQLKTLYDRQKYWRELLEVLIIERNARSSKP